MKFLLSCFFLCFFNFFFLHLVLLADVVLSKNMFKNGILAREASNIKILSIRGRRRRFIELCDVIFIRSSCSCANLIQSTRQIVQVKTFSSKETNGSVNLSFHTF